MALPKGEMLLTDLCSICHANTPKYRCPRDLARTCSLECTKKHKQRAACSGQRDPAAKLPKSDVYQPATVDSDFNFISGIERSLTRKERDDEERSDARKKTRRGELCAPAKRHYAFQQRLDEMRVIIDEAPKGMTRSRSNRTRWNDHDKSITWTVEWVHEDGERDLRDQKDTDDILTAFLSRFGAREKKKGQTGPKRKYHFYLLKPRVPSVKKVLVPVDPSKNIYQTLQDRVVLEYPTIYVFSKPYESASGNFILEDEYLDQFEKDQIELEHLLKEAKQTRVEAGSEATSINLNEHEWNAQNLADVLRQDLTNRSNR